MKLPFWKLAPGDIFKKVGPDNEELFFVKCDSCIINNWWAFGKRPPADTMVEYVGKATIVNNARLFGGFPDE